MTVQGTQDKYRAPALDKGLDILELLSTKPTGLTRSEIVKSLQRSPSEIYRMLERLVVRGYVGRSMEGDRYALTIKLFQMGAAYPPVRRLVARAQPIMDGFAQESSQSVHLVVPDLGQSYVVAQASSRSSWEFRLRLGAELDLFKTGSGLTLLASMAAEQLEHTLSMRLGAGQTPPTDLAKELETIRSVGYRLQPSQQLVGVMDMSVPLATVNMQAVGVLTCPFIPLVFDQQLGAPLDEPEQMEQCLTLLRAAAAAVSLA